MNVYRFLYMFFYYTSKCNLYLNLSFDKLAKLKLTLHIE